MKKEEREHIDRYCLEITDLSVEIMKRLPDKIWLFRIAGLPSDYYFRGTAPAGDVKFSDVIPDDMEIGKTKTCFRRLSKKITSLENFLYRKDLSNMKLDIMVRDGTVERDDWRQFFDGSMS
jgi:hypothetical protein